MDIHIFQHEEFEEPGLILEWANLRNHKIKIFKTFKEEFPAQDNSDLLIVLGGSMSANDNFDWLNKEKALIKSHIDKGKLVLGICLGAQLLAKILGAEVKKNKDKEIGWFPISCDSRFLKNNLTVFHWHGETFDLPDGATLLASSKACKNQAFVFNDNVLGLQFHLEINKESINKIVNGCASELVPGPFVQSAEEILANKKHLDVCREELFDLLDGFENSLG